MESGIRSRYWRAKKKGFCFADLVALGFHSTNVQEHTCVLISSPNRTTDLREKHGQVHESNDGSIVSFELRTHIVDKNTRSGSWSAARERTNAVSFVLSASWRNRSQVRGRGMMSGMRR